MARLAHLEGKDIALDTVVFIYALEGNREFGERAIKIFEMIEQGICQGFACDLVLAELMVKPLRQGQVEVAQEYAEDLPTFPNLTFRSVSRKTVIEAAKLRASSKLGLIDALHLAAAIEAKCAVFMTNDAAFSHQTPGIDIWMLSELES